MARPLTTFAITAPGFHGLNTADSPIDLSPNFALIADNCVVDKSGQISARKGWTTAHDANVDLSTSTIQCIGELIQVDGTATTLAAGGGYLFKLSGTTLVTLTYGGGGVAPTISANNWQFCQLNGVAMFWQRGYDPLIYDPAVSTTEFRRLNERAGSAGTVRQAHTALVAYGRVWCADLSTDKQTLYWSDILTPHIWTGGTSGSLDLRNVWPDGNDEVVALAAHNNFLYIFGRRQILIYSGADDPSAMTLNDTVVGIGCITRDTAIACGEDVWFLSDSGLRSLRRTIQEKSAPFRNISKNINDYLRDTINNSDLDTVKAGYSKVNDFYLLITPAMQQVLCFDTRLLLQDGSAKVTTWTRLTPSCFFETKGRKLYLGKAGYIGEYSGYTDNSASYRMRYFTTWIDFGNPVQVSILKKVIMTVIGGAGQTVIFKWAYDFLSTYFSESKTINGTTPLEYNTGVEYGSGAEYNANLQVNTVTAHGKSYGRVLQFGFEAQVSYALAVQKIELFTKEGRL